MDEDKHLDDSQIKFVDDDESANDNNCLPSDIPTEDMSICKNDDSPVDPKQNPKNADGGDDQKVVKRREKSRGRFRRKKHSKTQSVPDLETQVNDNGNEQFSESDKVAGNERKYNSMPRKSRSRSGSANRFSGLFRRKARSASAGASKSDTDIVGDQTTAAKEQNTENEPTFSYVRYSPTKQPRNRLKRMTVRDAVQERYSIHTNLYLIKQQKNEVGDPLSSSLPDVSNIDSIDSDPLVPNQAEMGDGGEFNKKCATLPRDKKHKARKSVDMKSPFDDRTLLIHCDINGNGACPPSDLPSSPSRVKIRDVVNNSSIDTDGKAGSDNDSDIFYDCDESVQNSAPSQSAKSAEAQNAPELAPNQDISEMDAPSVPITVYKSPDGNVQKQRDELRSLFFELSHTNPPRRDSVPVGNRDALPNAKLNDKLKNISTSSKERRDSGISDTSKNSNIDHDKISKHKVPSVSPFVKTKTSSLTFEDSKAEASKTNKQLPDQSVNGRPENDANSENKTNNDEKQGSVLNNALINFSLIYAPVMESFKMLTNKKPDVTVDKDKKEDDKGPDEVKEIENSADIEDISKKEAVDDQSSENDNKNDNHKIECVESPESGNFLEVPKRVDRSHSDGGVDYSKNKKKSPRTFQRSASDTPPPKASLEVPQNAVPIMGTSVSGKYRRKFGAQRGNREALQLPEGITLLDPGSSTDASSPTDTSASSSDASKSKSSTPDESFEGISPDRSLSREVSQKENESSSKKKKKNIGRTFAMEVRKSETAKVKTPDEESLSGEEAEGKLVETGTQTTEEDIRIAVKHMMKINKEQRKREKEWAKRKKEFIAVMEDTKKEREQLQRRQKINKERKEGDDKEIVDVNTSLPTPEIRVADDDGAVVTPSIESPNDKPLSPQEERKEDDKTSPDPKRQRVSNKKKKSKNKKGDKPVSILKRRISRKSKKKKGEEEKTKGKGEEEEEEEKFEDALSTGIDDDTFVFIENEINLSKLAEIKETDILDDEIVEPDISIEIPTKHLRFDTINLQPIQGEEPLPPISGRCSRRRDSTMRERRKKCLNAFKKFVAFLFSHIGLCSLVVAYTIMGGFVFKAIEGPYERSVKNGIREERIKVIDKLIQHAFDLKMNKSGRDSFSQAVEVELVDFQTKIHKETKENGWDGNDKKEFSDMQWSFASALLYAITVMTTIGYGHVAPKTPEGRIVTIGYAVLGIPLTLLCLTNIGDVMATGFRLLYGKVCCGVCCKLFSPKRRRMPDPEKGISRVVNTNEEEDKPKEVIHVPTSLCILLIAGYIFSGALLFSLWEKWDYLTGSYFCFITLSTIGFGDIVPGTDLQAWAGEEKLVLCALYLVFGLSLIAMCFNLVQEDVKAKCRWLGMKMGIIDKPESGVLN